MLWPPRRRAFALPFCLLFVLASCTEEANGRSGRIGGLAVQASDTAAFASVRTTPVRVGERWLGYLADERQTGSGGRDLNADGDRSDLVAVAYDMSRKQASPLAAAIDVHVLGDDVYTVTQEEEDGKDWNLDGLADDRVLLHWSQDADEVVFVASIERADILVVGERLYFSEELPASSGARETSLRWVSTDAPTLPVAVLAADDGLAFDPVVVKTEDDLIFLAQDELLDDRDYNGDGDRLDPFVLALLDGSDPAAEIQNVGLAVLRLDGALRAKRSGALGNDWLVAFLVGEKQQGGVNLNDPGLFPASWQPLQCAGFEDTDTLDLVLHCLSFRDWSSDPSGRAPTNTGLVGDERVLVMVDEAGAGSCFVGVISRELDEGGCSLNGDPDPSDRVLRWVEVTNGIAATPPGDAALLVALTDVPGGTAGVAEVDGRWVAVVSELDDQRDHDGDPTNEGNLLAWIDPADPQGAWTFPRSTTAPSPTGGDPAVWVSWLAERAGEGFVFTETERGFADSCNPADLDLTDSFARFGRFDPADPTRLEWEGHCYAAESFNAGMTVVGGTAYLRADERQNNRDGNGDGDRGDQVLLTHGVFPLKGLRFVSTLNDTTGPAVFTSGSYVVYVADESQGNRDLNKDGDRSDFVVRFLRAK